MSNIIYDLRMRIYCFSENCWSWGLYKWM